ncbi:putative ABI family protein [Helianthus annuus]|uniref:ABI family protein n=1 Tax=Helianthus annuus TaxID=4232 RepID=A0A251URR8_HELAN|nr:putative ABI family protein [Helianthus annuus]
MKEMEKNSIPSEYYKHKPQSESENDTKFCKSLQDLNDLCSQLHFAADSYQSTFLNSNQKQLVLNNTKEYIQNALVTVVDHLGSVSANLDHHLSKTVSIHQAEVKINILNQKLLTCQDYSHKIALAKVSERENHPKHNSRYIKPRKIFFFAFQVGCK